jgi:outer membrane protein
VAIWRQEKVDVDIAKAQQDIVVQELMYRVANSYFDVMISQESVDATNAQLEAMASLYGKVNAAYRNGNADIIDIDEIRSSLDLIRSQAVIARSDLDIRKQELQRLTGVPPARLAAAVKKDINIALVPEEMFLWEKKSLAASPALKLAELEIEHAKQRLYAARSERYPSLDLIINHGQSIRSNSILDNTNSTTLETIAAVQLEIPLYQGGATTARIHEAQANESKMKYLLRDATEQLLLGVREAYLDVKNGRLLMNSAYQAFSSGQTMLDSTYTAFDNGTRGSLDIANAQLALFDRKIEMVRSEYYFLASILRLKLTAGVLKIDDLREIDRFLDQRAMAANAASISSRID